MATKSFLSDVNVSGDLDITGNIITPEKMYMRYILNDAQQLIANNTNTLVNFPDAKINKGSGYTFISNTFKNTSGVDKKYFVRASITWDAVGGTAKSLWVTPPNGVVSGTQDADGVAVVTSVDNPSTTRQYVETHIYLEDDQTFQIGIWHNEGTSQNIGIASGSGRYGIYSTLIVSEI